MANRRPIFLLLWLVAAVFIFAWTMVSYQAQGVPQLKDEILLRHGLVMLILTLPSGLIWTAAVGSIVSLIGFELVGMADAVLVSLTCVVAGYWQWFVLLPWLWRKWKVKG
jgi:hypothetical protein